ncbi:hypothetical protein DL98DRAFT_596092 [Cadophora sp. DSE1049]|nr:hypothetical protein DL98DRAFT_596092 [Cadophora sp. DSE1049]
MAGKEYCWRVMEDRERGIQSAFARETMLDLTCAEDIGRFAVKAFVGEDTELVGRIVRVASEELMVGGMARVMTEVAGREVKVYWWSEVEIEEARHTSPMIAMQLGSGVVGVREYLESNKETLNVALRA